MLKIVFMQEREKSRDLVGAWETCQSVSSIATFFFVVSKIYISYCLNPILVAFIGRINLLLKFNLLFQSTRTNPETTEGRVSGEDKIKSVQKKKL